jgi:hypothetical protein
VVNEFNLAAADPHSNTREANMNTVHRIYTEDVDRKAVIRATSKMFDSFTLQPTTSYYRGKPERSIVIEIVGAKKSEIASLARSIGRINGQKSVLIISLAGRSRKIQLAPWKRLRGLRR